MRLVWASPVSARVVLLRRVTSWNGCKSLKMGHLVSTSVPLRTYNSIMNKLSVERRCTVLRLLCEGMSMRAIHRTTGASFNAVSRLLTAAGKAAFVWHFENVRGLHCPRIQADEVQTFVWAKPLKSWTWVAFSPDSKIVISYLVGDRSLRCGLTLMKDVRSRVVGRVQFTTDGLPSYVDSIEQAFGSDADFAVLFKTFGTSTLDEGYRARHLTETQPYVMAGNPDFDHISTAGVERSHLTLRQSVRRFSRRTLAFSRAFEKHVDHVALWYWYYNFARTHRSLRTKTDNRVTPAMAAGLTYRPAKFEELVSLIDALAPAPRRPKHYRKRQRAA